MNLPKTQTDAPIETSERCAKGHEKTRGPFSAKCLTCEPFWAQPCGICDAQRIACCC